MKRAALAILALVASAPAAGQSTSGDLRSLAAALAEYTGESDQRSLERAQNFLALGEVLTVYSCNINGRYYFQNNPLPGCVVVWTNVEVSIAAPVPRVPQPNSPRPSSSLFSCVLSDGSIRISAQGGAGCRLLEAEGGQQ